MTILAEVTFNDKGEMKEGLINEFFKNFNCNNTIEVDENGAKIKLVFTEQPPQKMIEVISRCHVDKLCYNGTMQNCKEEPKEEKISETETHDAEETTEEETKNAHFELSKIADNCDSYENFKEAVAEWLEMGKSKEIFLSILKSAEELEKITWKNIENLLKQKGIIFNDGNRYACSKVVANKFKMIDNNFTILKLIKEIVTYKTFDFGNQKAIEEDSKQTEKDEVENTSCLNSEGTENKLEKIFSNDKTEEILEKIFSNEGILAKLDKTLPIEKRVQQVFDAMGFHLLKDDKWAISRMTNIAMELDDEITWTAIAKQLKSNEKFIIEKNKYRLYFSRFINNFVKEHNEEKEYNEETGVYVIDFLKYLKKVIM